MNTSDRRRLESARELLTSVLDQPTVEVQWREDLVGIARSLIEKSKCLHPDLPEFPSVSQPWRILLLLFVAEVDGFMVTISDLALLTGVPATTSLRYQGLLVDQRLLVRKDDPMDARRTWLVLTEEARELIKEALTDFGKRFLKCVDSRAIAQIQQL